MSLDDQTAGPPAEAFFTSLDFKRLKERRFMFLGQAVEWIICREKTLPSEEVAGRLEEAERELFDAIAESGIRIDGYPAHSPVHAYEALPEGIWENMNRSTGFGSLQFSSIDEGEAREDGGTVHAGEKRWDGVRILAAFVFKTWPPIEEPQIEADLDQAEADHSKAWPQDTNSHIFLPRALNKLGRKLLGAEWSMNPSDLEVVQPVRLQAPHEINRRVLKMLYEHRPDLAKIPFGDLHREIAEELIEAHNRTARRHQEQFRDLAEAFRENLAEGLLISTFRPKEGGGQSRPADPTLWHSEQISFRFEVGEIDLDHPFQRPNEKSKINYIFVTKESFAAFMLHATKLAERPLQSLLAAYAKDVDDSSQSADSCELNDESDAQPQSAIPPTKLTKSDRAIAEAIRSLWGGTVPNIRSQSRNEQIIAAVSPKLGVSISVKTIERFFKKIG